jgi:hypothetical protein
LADNFTSDLTRSASDWEICFLGGAAFAVGGGAGMYFAVFRSQSVGALEPFYLTTTGIGAGGNATGFDLSNRKGLNWSPLTVVTPFSVWGLHLSAGTLISASVGKGIGKSGVNYGYSYLNAVRDGVTLFKTGGMGASVGSGIGAVAFLGLWYSHRLNNDSVNPITAYSTSIRQQIEEIVGTIDRGIRNLYGLPF